MIVETTFNGKAALVAYAKPGKDGGLEPATHADATLVKVIYAEGGVEFYDADEFKDLAKRSS